MRGDDDLSDDEDGVGEGDELGQELGQEQPVQSQPKPKEAEPQEKTERKKEERKEEKKDFHGPHENKQTVSTPQKSEEQENHQKSISLSDLLPKTDPTDNYMLKFEEDTASKKDAQAPQVLSEKKSDISRTSPTAPIFNSDQVMHTDNQQPKKKKRRRRKKKKTSGSGENTPSVAVAPSQHSGPRQLQPDKIIRFDKNDTKGNDDYNDHDIPDSER